MSKENDELQYQLGQIFDIGAADFDETATREQLRDYLAEMKHAAERARQSRGPQRGSPLPRKDLTPGVYLPRSLGSWLLSQS